MKLETIPEDLDDGPNIPEGSLGIILSYDGESEIHMPRYSDDTIVPNFWLAVMRATLYYQANPDEAEAAANKFLGEQGADHAIH